MKIYPVETDSYYKLFEDWFLISIPSKDKILISSDEIQIIWCFYTGNVCKIKERNTQSQGEWVAQRQWLASIIQWGQDPVNVIK